MTAPKPGTKRFPEDTLLYHGTRWQPSDGRWWEGSDPYPNRAGEDGGISFTPDPEASPKTRNANVLLEYKLTWDLDAIYCTKKGEFRSLVLKGEVCCTDAEQEIVFPVDAVSRWLVFVRPVRAPEK